MLLMPWDGEENAFRCQGVSWAGSGWLLTLPQAGYFGRLLQMPSSPPPLSPPAVHGGEHFHSISHPWLSRAAHLAWMQPLSPSPPPADETLCCPCPSPHHCPRCCNAGRMPQRVLDTSRQQRNYPHPSHVPRARCAAISYLCPFLVSQL